MDQELISAAERLARPCVLLKDAGPADTLASVWRGPGLIPPPPGPFRHWLSIDCSYLPEGFEPRKGVLSVYTNEDDYETGFVAHDESSTLDVIGGRPLYAHAGRSIPPPDAVDAVNDDAYERFWRSNCPVYSDEAFAVLGGWHFPWPDGDWELLRDRNLLVWTLKESEPWVEVWGNPGSFEVIQRIT